MKEINYLKGDATLPKSKGIQIIVHICNDIGGWGKGFVLAISKRWTEPENEYRKWYKNKDENNFSLGAVQFVKVSENIIVSNMIAQRGIKKNNNEVPIRYEAVSICLEKVAKEALKLDASIHMPRIGCGLAGGKWEHIETIIKEKLVQKDLNIFVYDFD